MQTGPNFSKIPTNVATFEKPRPFKIDIPKAEVERVQGLLKYTDLKPYLSKLAPNSEESKSDYDFAHDLGLKSKRLVSMVNRLQNGFDWYKWQDTFNNLGQHYKVRVNNIEDEPNLDVHCVYRPCDSGDKDALNLLLIHGWPGSFMEFYKMAPILSKKYNLIMPSIPGYTFSSSPEVGPEFTIVKAAQAIDAVCRALGWKKYITQGGDWGFPISRNIATMFPDRCRAGHFNMYVGGPKGELSEIDKKGKERGILFETRGTAYQYMHYSVPYTIGAMLCSSPVAALAYIGEKMYRWSAAPHINEDEIIANIMLYWYTQSMTSSLWLYYTNMGQHGRGFLKEDITVPTAFGGGPEDISWTNRARFEMQNTKIVDFKLLEKGGHFLALEEPEVLAKDVVAFINSPQVQESYHA